MFSIRFHGRGGQGMKTASHFLGNAFFSAGYEVQDAPRYGAERRGAPMTAYVRADTKPIYERGIISNPALVVVADESLVSIAAAGVMTGITADTVLLIVSQEQTETWQHRLNIQSPIITLPPQTTASHLISSACAAAAASLTGAISLQQLESAIKQELSGHDSETLENNLSAASQAYNSMLANQGLIKQRQPVSAQHYQKPEWVELALESADISAPTIHRPKTSVKIRTGLWRTQRPVIDYERCNHCWWVCSNSCPDSAINIEVGNFPVVDYDHCKGCMICVAQCPAHAIDTIAESDADKGETS